MCLGNGLSPFARDAIASFFRHAQRYRMSCQRLRNVTPRYKRDVETDRPPGLGEHGRQPVGQGLQFGQFGAHGGERRVVDMIPLAGELHLRLLDGAADDEIGIARREDGGNALFQRGHAAIRRLPSQATEQVIEDFGGGQVQHQATSLSRAMASSVGPPAPEEWNTITSQPSASSASRMRRVPFSVVPSVVISTSGRVEASPGL